VPAAQHAGLIWEQHSVAQRTADAAVLAADTVVQQVADSSANEYL